MDCLRTVFAAVSLKVEYAVTDLGRTNPGPP